MAVLSSTAALPVRHSEIEISHHGINKSNSEVKNQLIKEVALNSLKEFVISLLFVGASCLFVATSIGVLYLICLTVIITTVNTLLRILAAFFQYRSLLAIQRYTPKYFD